MFQFTSYLDKINQIKWYIPDNMVNTLSQDLFVTFQQIDDYYLIENVHYSYIDILMGLEGYNLTLNKRNVEIIITIHSHS